MNYFTYGTHASPRDLVTSTTNNLGNLRRYFSSIDAEVYLGGERLIDISRIDYEYEERKMPVYGYNSFYPSNIFKGQKLITGSFAINFIKSGYIAEILSRSSTETSSLFKETSKSADFCNDDHIPIFEKEVDILIGYGNWNTSVESFRATHQVLQGVNINGYKQVLDSSGEPIYEIYTFIAKNLKLLNLPSTNEEESVQPEESESIELEVIHHDEAASMESIKENMVVVNDAFVYRIDGADTSSLILSFEGTRTAEISDLYITSNNVELALNGDFMENETGQGKIFRYVFDINNTKNIKGIFDSNGVLDLSIEISTSNDKRIYLDISISGFDAVI